MGFLLDILYLVYFVLYLPFLLLRGKWHGGMFQRFGIFPRPLAAELASGENIWVHAVSVGEVALVDGIIKGLRRKYPQRRVVLSVATRAGHEFARGKYAREVTVIWAPFDLGMTVSRFVTLIRPLLYVAAETEIWPHLFRALDRKGVPIVIVNARISDGSYPRYRMLRGFFGPTLAQARLVCAQSPLDAGRLIALGVDKMRVHVTGNLKFDVLSGAMPVDRLLLRQRYGVKPDEKFVVAASTHPGEDEVVIGAYRYWQEKFPRLRLAIAPRHPERAGEVGRLIRANGSACSFYGKANALPEAGSVIVIDAVGHLLDLYGAADVVFIGKSLGLPRRGGQNPIEPAALGRPVITGPYMENFRDVMRLFREAGAVVEIAHGRDLASAVEEVLAHPQRMAGLCVRAKAVVEANRGAVTRTLDLMAGLS